MVVAEWPARLRWLAHRTGRRAAGGTPDRSRLPYDLDLGGLGEGLLEPPSRRVLDECDHGRHSHEVGLNPGHQHFLSARQPDTVAWPHIRYAHRRPRFGHAIILPADLPWHLCGCPPHPLRDAGHGLIGQVSAGPQGL
jgi:hypothetical protein